jgi:hypothetical protein
MRKSYYFMFYASLEPIVYIQFVLKCFYIARKLVNIKIVSPILRLSQNPRRNTGTYRVQVRESHWARLIICNHMQNTSKQALALTQQDFFSTNQHTVHVHLKLYCIFINIPLTRYQVSVYPLISAPHSKVANDTQEAPPSVGRHCRDPFTVETNDYIK